MASSFRADAYINGEWRGGAKRFPVYNPATQEVIAQVPDLGASDCEDAIAAADAAFPAWAAKDLRLVPTVPVAAFRSGIVNSNCTGQ